MQEKIGKVTLDYEFYPGEDLYSDGPVEEELLEIARSYGEEELNRVIAEKNSWPVLYHFSHIPSEYTGVASNPENRQGSGNWLWMRSYYRSFGKESRKRNLY